LKLSDYLNIGHYLYYVEKGPSNNVPINGGHYLLYSLDQIEESLKSIKSFEKFENDIENLRNTMILYKDNKIENKQYVDRIENYVLGFRSKFKEYIDNQIVFESVDNCTLDKNCLLKLRDQNQSPFFKSSIWENLSDIAKSDFSDAAKCLLLGASTPAVMITLRAAEDVVRNYYKYITGKDYNNKAWGSLLSELKKIDTINKDLIEHLDYLRKTRRNLAQHPDKVYNQREAELIFMEIISTTHDIFSDI